MQNPMKFMDYNLLRFKHEVMTRENIVQDTQVLHLRYGSLIEGGPVEWIIRVFHIQGNKEIEVPLAQVTPEENPE